MSATPTAAPPANRWQVVFCVCCFVTRATLSLGEDVATFTPTAKLVNSESKDQDDICVWIHPQDRARSTIITSDKSANRVFVYDLERQLLQSIPVAKPGNIDIRQAAMLDGLATTDVVVVNQRADGFKLVIFRVDPETRKLERIDDECVTGPNYGGCLYLSRKDGRLYFVCTSDTGMVEQYELTANVRQRIKTQKVRTLKVGKCEGAVADDEAGILYLSEEKKGVWKFGAEPDASLTGSLIAAVGDNGLKGDVEGLALYKGRNGISCLLVSDQGRNRFMAFQRETPHKFIREFAVEGAVQTDGIEVCSANLGPKFPEGLFACHTDQSPRAILLIPLAQIAAELSHNLAEK